LQAISQRAGLVTALAILNEFGPNSDRHGD